MAFNRYASFYGAFNNSLKHGNPMSKEETVLEFTDQRTKSLQDLTDTELATLVANLNQMTGARYIPDSPEEKEKDSLRKAIISQFLGIYRTAAAAIAWAEKYGVNGKKKRFNDYDKGELFLLLQNAKKVASDWQISMRKNAIK